MSKIGNKEWYKYGVKVTEKFCKNKEWEKISVQDILSERNVQRRMMLIQLVGIEKIVKEGKLETLEEIKATQLYRQYPIGDYYQQGDVLIKPSPISKVTYDELDLDTKKRLAKITYKLVEIPLSDVKHKYLVMTNASHKDILHCEGVDDKCKNVFEAICFRNDEKYLPFKLS